ncbi:hypothetical protein vseg_009380 [Gypsophila vaccaria]
MKGTHLKTQHDPPSFISYVCSKPAQALLVLLVILTRKITAVGAVGRFDYPGNETDCAALLAVKSQLKDHSDGVLSSWNNSVHHCAWEGITCGNKHKRVTVLDLNSEGLSGTISPFISNLSFLSTISLYNNSLYGQIPHNIGNLVRLQALLLHNNSLIGEIPANVSGCINLRFLYVHFNKIEGKLPAELGALSKLRKLIVNNNKFAGPLFNVVQNLTSLVTLFADYNMFTGNIPQSIGRMQNLTYLGLGANKLSGTLPMSLFNLSSLQLLELTDNLFHGELPPHLGFTHPRLTWLGLSKNNFSGSIQMIRNLTNLESIILHENSFTGKVLHDFHQFRNLSILSLSYNYLQGDINFISTLLNCTQLRSLQLDANDFFGMLPRSVANLSNALTSLTIGDSPISGVLPAGITNLVNLRVLYMGNSILTGSIPPDIEKLHKLELFDLHSNQLTGIIPHSLGKLSRLSTLYIDDNRLTESIPQSIGNCQSLLYMDLSNNELSGTLDDGLFQASATFVELDLSYNRLEGPLPLTISKQTGLGKLGLSSNKFSGQLPDGLSECTELQLLYMKGNSFHGDIPSSYASLASLQEVDFSQNNLSGPILDFFSRISSIYYLNLSYNDFQGMVPTNSVFANASAVFLVGNTKLCGGIKELHLPKCAENKSMEGKKGTMSHSLKIIIPVISAIVLVVAIVTGIYLTCIRKKKTPSSSELVLGKAVMRVSYDELLKATGGFSSERLLGSGSFGSVFKGILDGKTVAVKVLNSEHRASSHSFLAECKALRNVRHRNLVRLITACSSIDFQRNDFKALVYEFMPNGSLDKWLHGAVGNMSLPQRVGVAIDVAHAINYLHHECETVIAHCDLKPSNILLDDDMVAHVGDFGLARFLTPPRHPNQSSTIGILGTVGYAAPEYGLGSEKSTAGDVYSYGILLLELMTGKNPTDDMFKDGYDLHMYGEAALPNRVLQIVDSTLEEDNLTEVADDKGTIQCARQWRAECINSVISVGVACSNRLPQDRMKITEAISRLEAARVNLLNARNKQSV